ncbi:MAG: hypothetical protein D4R73_01510 [Deltaproteobacteria bacterium]|nr:MAG: hypothetical protein D4R73_01510 [Deltaproteobacteria bacterium]
MAAASLCRQCGRCCWDWKGDAPGNKCEYLADDMTTCKIYGRRSELNRAECDALMQPHQAVDLPRDCGYMAYWREQGLI